MGTQANQTGHGEAKQAGETTGSNAGEGTEGDALEAQTRETDRVKTNATGGIARVVVDHNVSFGSKARVSVEQSALAEVYELAVEMAGFGHDCWAEEDVQFVDQCLDVVKTALSQVSIPASGEPERGVTS